MKVGVIGKGVLGSAVLDYYKSSTFFDIEHGGDLKSVCECDFIFICVPTPVSKGISIVEECVERISSYKSGENIYAETSVVVIKSTMLVGSTKLIQDKYPGLPIMYCPEFLTESISKADFRNPDKNIIGYTEKSLEFVYNLKAILPHAPYFSVLDSTSAEIIKLSINSYYAMKVIFGNMVYDICEEKGGDYDLVKEGFVSDKRITDSHFDIFHGDYRGFGGKCLPKDLEFFSEFLSSKSSNIIDKIFVYNKELVDEIN